MLNKIITFKSTFISSLILWMLCLNVVYAQKYSSSKLKRYQTIDSASIYLDSAKYLSDKSPFLAIKYLNRVIELSIKDNDKKNETAAYIILGNIQQQLEQHSLAISNFKKAIGYSQDKKKSAAFEKQEEKFSLSQKKVLSTEILPDKNIFTAYKQIAVSYIALKEFDEADNAINNCIYTNYSGVMPSDKMDAKRLQALIKHKQQKNSESLKILEEVYKEDINNGNLYGQVVTNIAIGKVYEEIKNETSAINYYLKAKNLAEKNNFNKLLIEANDLLAKIYRSQKNVDKEVEIRSNTIKLISKSNNTAGVQQENFEIGNAFYNNKEIEKAEPYYEKAIQEVANALDELDVQKTETKSKQAIVKSKDLENNSKTYKMLTVEYLKRKEFKKAHDYFKLYVALQDSITNTRKKEFDEAILLSNNIGQNQQRLELLEKERELSNKSIGILRQDRELKEKQLDMRNSIIGILILFILLMIVAAYLVYKSFKEKKKAHQILALKSLRGQMNPHFIFNALNSVNHYISQNDERLANRYLSNFSRLMRLVLDSSKHDLISVSDELDMLKIYLQLEHLRFNNKFDYNIRFVNDVEHLDYEIPPMLIQPYLENAIWHGLRYIDGKGKLDIEFESKDNGLLITISDNGIGRGKSKELKTQNQKKQVSVGMQNIENRIQLMNEIFNSKILIEVFDLDPKLEYCGTCVKLFIPQKN